MFSYRVIAKLKVNVVCAGGLYTRIVLLIVLVMAVSLVVVVALDTTRCCDWSRRFFCSA